MGGELFNGIRKKQTILFIDNLPLFIDNFPVGTSREVSHCTFFMMNIFLGEVRIQDKT